VLFWDASLNSLVGDWKLSERYRASIFGVRLSIYDKMTGNWKYGGKQSMENRTAQSETNIWKKRRSPRPLNGIVDTLAKVRNKIPYRGKQGEFESRKIQLRYGFSKGYAWRKTISRFFLSKNTSCILSRSPDLSQFCL
jgi:hypothetical protein